MKFNPDRLAIARKRRLLNKKELAALLDVTEHTIVRWGLGQSEPTPENVSMMSRRLEYPKDFFFGPSVDEASAEFTSFRSQKSMTAARRDAALAAGSIGFLISDWVKQRFDTPLPNIPDLSAHQPEEAAHVLRQEWGIGERPISNMIQMLEAKGVVVFSLSENTVEVNAYSLWRKNTPYVFLNTFKTAESSRFDAAHELAHLVIHLDGKVRGRAAEDQADQFASAFLMPRAAVTAALPQIRDIHQLIEAKQRWGVSLAALAHRVHKLGLISDWRYRDLCIEISKRGFYKEEPNGISRETSVVWQRVLTSLWAEKTTQNDIAEAIHVPTQEVSDLLFGVLNYSESKKDFKAQALTLLSKAENDRASQQGILDLWQRPSA